MSQRKTTIYLCGPHSSGKTTLQNDLQKHPEFSKFGFKSQEEIARYLIEKKGITPEQLRHPETMYDILKDVLVTQYKVEEKEIEENGENYSKFLWDRGIIDPIAYVKVYVGQNEADMLLNLPYVKKTLERWKRGQDCMIFILKPESKYIEHDGVRPESDIKELENLYEAMVNFLEILEIEYVVISCTNLDKRTRTVVDAVKKKWNLNP